MLRMPKGVLDRLLLLVFLGFALTSFLFDRLAGLDQLSPHSSDPLAAALWDYGTRFDPLVRDNPLFLRIMSWISAFVFGPFYLVLVWGLLDPHRRLPKLRMAGIAWAGAMIYSMIVHLAAELIGPLPPPNLAVFWAVYLPYLLAPVLLLWRLRAVPG